MSVFKAGRMGRMGYDGKQNCVYTLWWGARGKDCIMFALNKLAWVQEGCSHGSSTGQLVCYFLFTSGPGGQPWVLAVIFPAAFPQ